MGRLASGRRRSTAECDVANSSADWKLDREWRYQASTMSGFLKLWERSRELTDAEDSQQYVRNQLEAVCGENHLQFWRCSDKAPKPVGRSLFVGVAEYVRADLELLDQLCLWLDKATLPAQEVTIFCLTDCKDIASIERIIPEVRRLPAQNPLVALWLDGECLFAGGSQAAIRWLRENVGGEAGLLNR